MNKLQNEVSGLIVAGCLLCLTPCNAMMNENSVSNLERFDLGNDWFGVDRDGDDDYEMMYRSDDHQMADEVYQDDNNDGLWDIWKDNTNGDDDAGFEHYKRDTNGDGKFDQEWIEGKDDADDDEKPGDNDWRKIKPEAPEQKHPKDQPKPESK